MSISENYLDYVISKLIKLKESQREKITEAAGFIADSCIAGGRFYVFGSGHSHMVAEEIYIRAGGLAFVKAILEPSLMLHEMPNKSTYLERLDGYSSALLKLYKVEPKDTLMVISNSGRNPVPVEMVLEAKKIGCRVIAVTSMEHSSKVSSRHNSGLKMYEAADVTIDNCADFGDAAYIVEGAGAPTGPISDIVGTAIAQTLIVTAVEAMVKRGFDPPIFKSSNVDGADDYNDMLFDKYYGYMK
jgi:uncharacterized phosphosugar-binding protein